LRRSPRQRGALGKDHGVLSYVREAGEGQRILASAIVEKFAAGPDGALVPLTEGSTRPVASVVRHAGIVKTQRYSFDMP
jgi:hypothetical protein